MASSMLASSPVVSLNQKIAAQGIPEIQSEAEKL
jgi:hypothetical protein